MIGLDIIGVVAIMIWEVWYMVRGNAEAHKIAINMCFAVLLVAGVSLFCFVVNRLGDSEP